jgi:hypothetical protein
MIGINRFGSSFWAIAQANLKTSVNNSIDQNQYQNKTLTGKSYCQGKVFQAESK